MGDAECFYDVSITGMVPVPQVQAAREDLIWIAVRFFSTLKNDMIITKKSTLGKPSLRYDQESI